ncbi:MarR family winged helix-turn-helix transcriptional regulator [Chelatococcus sp. GCM10030263]|uniref:MarR family winged helix-turn-helix transcriptional regulator n=1 Tax=Chelatococcus sp. GCM10030263 TaxID=3273387 RepID=UPI0036075D9A
MTRKEAASRRSRSSRGAVDYAALAEFRYAIRRFLAFSERAAAEAGITSQQHQALLTIKGVAGEEGLAVGALAERLLVKQHTAVELVDRLERAGLVRRGADPADGRRVLVSLTKEGEQRLRALSSAHLDELKSIGPALSAILAGLRDEPKADD